MPDEEEKLDLPAQAGEKVEPLKPYVHTYADDLEKALDTTEASVVQELLVEGRERETIEIETRVRSRQKGWYSVGAIILSIFTLAAVAYTIFHYTRLTVPAQRVVSVGVFPSTEVFLAPTTDIRAVVGKLKSDTTLETNKPSLVPLVSDGQTLTLLSNSQLFSFFEAQASEPFLTSFSLFRLGVMNTGGENVPFVIGAVTDVDIASKELLIAEPQLLRMFYKALGIDIASVQEEVGATFSGEYLYNIPVRILRYQAQDASTPASFFYARVSDDIVVFTTTPSVLKSIYDSLISQQK